MDRSFTLGSTEEADNVKILQSCNGLLLRSGLGLPVFYYVYNPSTNQYKKLPYLDCSLDNSPYYSSAGLRIAFDPTKSPHYKLVDAGRTFCDIDIQIYSSKTGKWSLCSDRFNYFSFDHFDSAIYLNDGLHWLETENRQLMHYSLNIEDPDHPIITTIPIPQRGMTFLKSYGYIDPMQILIQMSHLLQLEGKLFVWRGSLFLVCLDDFGSREFTIYEMTIGCSVWMVRYRVHIDDFMTLLPEAGLSHLWEVLYSRVNEHSLLIAELNVFGGPLAFQCVEFFKQLSKTEVLKMLETRKSIAEVHKQVHKKIDFLTVMRLIFVVIPFLGTLTLGLGLADLLVLFDNRDGWSFTLGSTEEADNVKILQSCNGLLLCGGLGLPVFYYVYNLSTNQYKKLPYRVHTDDFMTFLLEGWLIRSNVWRIVLGEREQDSFLVIKLSGKVVQYNLISKTLHEIYDCGSNQLDDKYDDNDDDDDDDELL
ncbi:hypothetical protein Tco_0881514 [Tanacetum coccineum]